MVIDGDLRTKQPIYMGRLLRLSGFKSVSCHAGRCDSLHTRSPGAASAPLLDDAATFPVDGQPLRRPPPCFRPRARLLLEALLAARCHRGRAVGDVARQAPRPRPAGRPAAGPRPLGRRSLVAGLFSVVEQHVALRSRVLGPGVLQGVGRGPDRPGRPRHAQRRPGRQHRRDLHGASASYVRYHADSGGGLGEERRLEGCGARVGQVSGARLALVFSVLRFRFQPLWVCSLAICRGRHLEKRSWSWRPRPNHGPSPERLRAASRSTYLPAVTIPLGSPSASWRCVGVGWCRAAAGW